MEPGVAGEKIATKNETMISCFFKVFVPSCERAHSLVLERARNLSSSHLDAIFPNRQLILFGKLETWFM